MSHSDGAKPLSNSSSSEPQDDPSPGPSMSKASGRRSGTASKEQQSPPHINPQQSGPQSQDGDLFSFLSAMHLSGGGGGLPTAPGAPVQLVSSRKRKLLEQGLGGHGEFMGGKGRGVRAFLRRNSDDEPALHTPQCSQSGYNEEDLDGSHGVLAAVVAAAAQRKGTSVSGGLLSPVNPHLMNEIDLATNFDDSLSGLGVDINTASMSEAILANLPNLSISSSQYFKSDHHSKLKEEPDSSNSPGRGPSSQEHPKNFGALDLSNDGAHLPDGAESDNSSQVVGPRTFFGSVSRETSRDGTPTAIANSDRSRQNSDRKNSMGHEDSSSSQAKRSNSLKGKSETLSPTFKESSASAMIKTAAINNSKVERYERLNETTIDSNKFQYILVASTSIATKINEPSITYLNQGQSYELRLKKLGDLSTHRKKLLRCVMRICFHERRLQYMEAEQIAEWKAAHAGERILDFDLPLSYGVMEPTRDAGQLNVLSFKWDPTRDTGIFIKVNCISTEFTPKKHGGEKGVPFRLQLETLDPTNEDVRLHAAGCILQVFKLKGADRKHKQDRDKISKRSPSEQVKFSPSYECTVLNDLSIENIYVPPSSGSVSPPALDKASPQGTQGTVSASASRDGSPGHMAKTPVASTSGMTSSATAGGGSSTDLHGSTGNLLPPPNPSVAPIHSLPIHASAECVITWLSQHRFTNHVAAFRNYNGRDLLRLMREELITLCGLGEGIRLYNELHMVQVAPRTTFYVAQKDTDEYHALFLEDLTLQDLVGKLAHSIGVDASVFGRLFILGPSGILIRVTDSVIQYTKPETIFQFSLRRGLSGDLCDVLFEDMTPMLHANDGDHHVLNHGNSGNDGSGGEEFHPPMMPVPLDVHALSHSQQVCSHDSSSANEMMPPPTQQHLQHDQQEAGRGSGGHQMHQQQEQHRERSQASDN